MADVERYTGDFEAHMRKKFEAHVEMVKDRIKAFVVRWGYKPDALIMHPTAMYVLETGAFTGMAIVYDSFCPIDEIYPINREAMQRQERANLEARIKDGHEAEAKRRWPLFGGDKCEINE